MNVPSQKSDVPEIDRVPSGIVKAMAALLLWLLVPWWLILGASSGGTVTFAVCVIFSVIAFGIASICFGRAIHVWWRRKRKAPPRGIHRRFATFTGPLPLSEATVQLLMIPGAVAIGFTVLALVNAAERITS